MGDYIVFATLFLFGVGYNYAIAWLERQGYHEGYVSYLVVFGTLVTIFGAYPLIGRDATLLVLACFVASGLPMIIGSCHRHAKERREKEKRGSEHAWDLAREFCHMRMKLVGICPYDNTEESWGLRLEQQPEQSFGVQPAGPGVVKTGTSNCRPDIRRKA